tara:strand:- start:37 stop:219 length:183 start_codon:yes stop_codon:yes gene_type:complete
MTKEKFIFGNAREIDDLNNEQLDQLTDIFIKGIKELNVYVNYEDCEKCLYRALRELGRFP